MSEATLLKTKAYWAKQPDSPNKEKELAKIERNLKAYAIAKDLKEKSIKSK